MDSEYEVPDPKEAMKAILTGSAEMLVMHSAMGMYDHDAFATWPGFCTSMIESAGEQKWDTSDFFIGIGEDDKCLINHGNVPSEAVKIVLGLLIKHTRERTGGARFAAMVIEFKVNPEAAQALGVKVPAEVSIDDISTPADLPEPNEVRAVYLISAEEIQIHSMDRQTKKWTSHFVGTADELRENQDVISTNGEVAFAAYLGSKMLQDESRSLEDMVKDDDS